MARWGIFLQKDKHCRIRWIPSFLGMQHIQQLFLSNIQHIVVCWMDQQCFHRSQVLFHRRYLGIQRWWLVPISLWWCIHLQRCTNIGYILDWIPSSKGNMLDSWPILRHIGWSSLGLMQWQSFHQIFHCTYCLDNQWLVVWFQWRADLFFDQQLKLLKICD